MNSPAPADLATYPPKILAAYEQSVNASKGSLNYAIEAGGYLNLAKEAMPKKGEWLFWLGHNCPDIPQTTASLYMRLAKSKTEIDKQRVASSAENGELSIRAAARLIPAKAGAKPKNVAAKKVKKVETIEAILEDLEVDEVYTALRNTHDAKYLSALAQMIMKEKGDGSVIPPVPVIPPRTEPARRM